MDDRDSGGVAERLIRIRRPDSCFAARRSAVGLDDRTSALVAVAAALALQAPLVTVQGLADRALHAGATSEEIVAVLLVAAPTIGSARVVRAVPALALAIGYDIDSALELMGDERLGDGECAGGA